MIHLKQWKYSYVIRIEVLGDIVALEQKFSQDGASNDATVEIEDITTNLPKDLLPIPKDGWTCFHCGEVLKTVGAARDHFGKEPTDRPACQIKVGHERGLLMAYRKCDALLAELESEALKLDDMLMYGRIFRVRESARWNTE